MRGQISGLGRGLLAAAMLMLAASSGCVRGVRTHENLQYSTAGPRPVHLAVYVPRGLQADVRRPCVVLIHGGSWVFGSRDQLRWYGRRFAEAGYIAASISYRKLPRHTFLDSVHDAKAAVRWLRLHAGEYQIDPERIAVLGNSAGGHLAAMLAATDGNPVFEGEENPGAPSGVSAAVILYGALDLRIYREPTTWVRHTGIPQHLVARYVRDGTGGGDPFAEASPISYFSPRTVPTLLIHGEEDGIVPVDVAQDAYAALRAHDVPARFIMFPRRGHAFDFFYPALRREVFAYTCQFLDEHLECRETDGAWREDLRGGI